MKRLRLAARRAAASTNLVSGVENRLPASPELAWHLLESHAVTKQTREGKRYKEWLFARVGHSTESGVSILEAGASLMMRDVALNLLRRECLHSGTYSLDEKVSGGEDGNLTYADLLPDEFTPADDVAARELESMAKSEAATFFDTLSFRERVAVLAKLKGIPLYNDQVLALCNCSKSLLSRTMRAVFSRLPKQLEEHYPTESPADIRALAVMAIRELEKETNSWASVENLLPDLFQ